MKLKSMTILLLGLGVLGATALDAQTARPGTLNYVEGAVSLEGQQLTDKSVGSVTLNPGETLTTQAGKAEILLTPGVFLRIDDNSAVRMVSPNLTLTQVELVHGRAGVEVDEIHPENDLELIDSGVTTQLVKPGYYEFDANNPTVMVFDGKAAVEVREGKYKVVKSHHELQLAPAAGVQALAKEKPVEFDTRKAKDDLYNWNSLRSEYLAEDNNQIAGEYADSGSYNPGWFWDPYAMDYTFIGGGPFWSSFGYGFYPFGWGGMYGGGYYGGGYYGGGYYGGNGYNRYGNTQSSVGGRPVGGPIRGGHYMSGSSFHGGGGFHGGSFSGGGFHGGGGGGGFGGGGFGGGGFHGGGGGGGFGGGGGHR